MLILAFVCGETGFSLLPGKPMEYTTQGTSAAFQDGTWA